MGCIWWALTLNNYIVYILGAANWFEVSALHMVGVDEAMRAAVVTALPYVMPEVPEVPEVQHSFRWPWK